MAGHIGENSCKWASALSKSVSKEMEEKARTELKETKDGKEKGIERLKSFCERERLPPLDDNFLIGFLRVSKFDLAKAETRLHRYYQMRYKMANFFDKYLDENKFRKILEIRAAGVLPLRDEQGRTFIYSAGGFLKPEECDFEYVTACFLVLMHYLGTIPPATIAGVRYLCDCREGTIANFYRWYKAMRVGYPLQSCMPFRLQKVDAFRDISLGRFLFDLLKPLLSAKLVNRISLHGENVASLHNSVNPELLPFEFEGKSGQLDNGFFIDKFMEFVTKFKTQNSMFLKPVT